MNYDNIGEFIKEKRKEKNLTQKELASKIGVTDKAVSKWETGLGCPDVSILEILSKELDCSILELLKGREIKEEVIPVIEMDDYIKESIEYGKNSLKSIISKLIAAIVVFIVITLFTLNIINMYNQRKEYNYVSDSIMIEIGNRIDIINKNTSIIKKNQGKFAKDDYDIIVNSLNKIQEGMEANQYTKYRNGEALTNADLYIIDDTGFFYTDLINIFGILNKYDSGMKKIADRIVESIGTRMMLGSKMAQEPVDLTYKYQFMSKASEDMDISKTMTTQARFYDMYYRLGLYVDATNYVIEVGDINE